MRAPRRHARHYYECARCSTSPFFKLTQEPGTADFVLTSAGNGRPIRRPRAERISVIIESMSRQIRAGVKCMTTTPWAVNIADRFNVCSQSFPIEWCSRESTSRASATSS